jgi:hypothetical protein
MPTDRERLLAEVEERRQMIRIPRVTGIVYACVPPHLVIETLLMLGLISEWPVVDRRTATALKVSRAVYTLPTHCRHGHEYTTANTSTATGYRRCLTCAAIQLKARRKREQERKTWPL